MAQGGKRMILCLQAGAGVIIPDAENGKLIHGQRVLAEARFFCKRGQACGKLLTACPCKRGTAAIDAEHTAVAVVRIR